MIERSLPSLLIENRGLVDQVEALKKRIVELEQLSAERDLLRQITDPATVDRYLTARREGKRWSAYMIVHGEYESEREELIAENARLRQALEEIAGPDSPSSVPDEYREYWQEQIGHRTPDGIARAALAHSPEAPSSEE